ncbi:hypothetical protein [Streptomyces griseus]|uniref:hypothetical protein n=1 Tax=Streptomyces griseus TaxID=1911 RepID=UPI0004C52A55|nr:hypothetical protein [Streptomyces griseus]
MLKGVAPGLAVCLLATACGGGEKPEPERVTAGQQCDGLLSPRAARALETVLETKRFWPAGSGGLERVAGGLTADYAKAERRPPSHQLCDSGLPGGGPHGVTIKFRLYEDDELLSDRRPVGLHPYDMGVEAHAGPDRAYLFARCVSPRVEGSDSRDVRIEGKLTHAWSKLPDTVPVREAHLAILHSATLAVVRRLGCEGDAGLDAEPVFRPRGG